MANATRTIDMVFNGVDKTAAAVNSAVSNTNKFSKGIQDATAPVANFTSSALKLEAGIVATGAAITAFAVKTAGDFDSAFREISTLIDAPVESIDRFRQAILDYGASSTAPLEEVTNAIYSAISAGVDFEDAIAAVSVAEQLSVAGKADLNDSLVVLVSSLNAYGLGMEEAGRFSDALFTTVRLGQTTLPELSAGLAQVTGTAATLGVPFEEVLAALAALTSAGTPTAQAVTQINGVLAALLKPSDGAAKTAKQLGIEFDAQAVKAQGLAGVLESVGTATGGNEALMAKLFPRVESLRAIFPLTGLAASTFADNLVELQNSTGATAAAFQKMEADIKLASQQVNNSLKAFLIGVGTPLLDEFGGVSAAISEIFATLAKDAGSGALSDVVAFIEGEFSGLESVLQTVAANLPEALGNADFSGFTNGLVLVRDAIVELFSSFDLTSADGIADVITTIGSAFESLSGFSGGAITSFKPLIESLAQIGDNIINLGPEIAETAGNIGGFAKQANILSGTLISLLPAIEGVFGLFLASKGIGYAKAIAETTASLTGLGAAVTKLSVLGATGGAGGAVGFGIGTALNELAEIATGTSISTFLTDLIVDFGLLDDEATNIVDSLNDVPFDDTGKSAKEAAQEIELADQAMSAFGAKADSAAETALNFSTGLYEVQEAANEQGTALERSEQKLREFEAGLANSSNSIITLGEDSKGTFSVVSSGADAATKSITDLSKASDDLKSKVLVASIEGATDIAVAQIEGDAQKISSAFESIGQTVTQTGQNITDLFSLFGDENISKLDKLGLQDQIEIENGRLDDQLKLQKRLTDAQINELNKRAQAYQSGGALIEVDGSGLQPHLEAFMFEILSAIQLRVAGPGGRFLLGLGT